jgi:Cu+-exporting ATPase
LSARLLNALNQIKVVNIHQLKRDDVIELRNGELVPADSTVVSPFITVDYSFITGESIPVALSLGEKVYAGAKIAGNTAQLKLMTDTDNSRLVKLWSVEKTKDDKEDSLTEKINYYFTLGLLLISAFAFIYQYQVNGVGEAFKSLTSVLIVACPCILLLATNFANGHLLRSLKENGLFVKNKQTINQLRKCDTIVFDKTGTLTDNSHYIIEDLTNLNTTEKQKMGLVCHQSIHPYSVALSKAYYTYSSDKMLNAFADIAGKGLQGEVDGLLIRLGSAKFIGTESLVEAQNSGVIHVEIDSVYRGYFELRHDIRSETKSILEALKVQNYDLYLSSGDTELNEEIDKNWFNKVFIKQQPEDKVALIQSLKKEGKVVCMAGDGLNDAPALKEADIAISVADSTSSFFPACDVLIKAEQLGQLPTLLKFVNAAKWVIIISFVFSLLYNVVGLYFAITAQLSPLIAAILMPSSSMTMLVLTWLLTVGIKKSYKLK